MRRSWLVRAIVSCAALLACQRREEPAVAPPPPEPVAAQSPRDWIAEAPGGRATIRQATVADGCNLTAVVSGATPWVANTCAANRDDLRFVSSDGERLLVLYPLPADVRGKDWSEAVVARIFVRGREDRRFIGSDLVAPRFIADMSHDFSWVKGVGTGGGNAPRYAADGSAVVLDELARLKAEEAKNLRDAELYRRQRDQAEQQFLGNALRAIGR